MKIDRKFLVGIIVFGSLWGFAECILGGVLRDVNLPAGAIMTGVFAVGLMTLSRTTFARPGMQTGIGLIAGGLRLFNPFGGCFICSAIAIMAEGLLFDLIWTGFSLDKKTRQTLTNQVSLGITSAYLVYVGGYIITQILTPVFSSAGFYLENLLVFIPQILASGLLAALLYGFFRGVFLGTRILISVSERIIYLALAVMILAFQISVYLNLRIVVPPRWEGALGPAVGFAGGVLAGVTNVVGPLTALYILALGFEKREFVKAVASIFFVTKVSQLVAISRWGLYTTEILWWSVGLSAVALLPFWLGLRVQDRVPQETFRPRMAAEVFPHQQRVQYEPASPKRIDGQHQTGGIVLRRFDRERRRT